MGHYDYPYADFSCDFDAVLPSANAVALDEMQRMMIFRNHYRSTYQSDVDRVERGAAVGLAWDLLTAWLCVAMNTASSQKHSFEISMLWSARRFWGTGQPRFGN